MIVAHWELPEAWKSGFAAKKAFTRWSHTAKAFGQTELRFVESKSDPMPQFGDQEVSVSAYPSLDAALEGLDAGRLVYIEEGGEALETYPFPEDPVFIFGSDYSQLPKADVSLNTIIPLHADVALGIVLNAWRG